MLSKTKLLGAVLAVGAMSVSGLAFAQAPAAAPRPAAPAPAAPAGAPGAPAGAPTGPMKVELKPAQPDWTKVCGKDQTAGKEVCYTTRDYGTQPDQPPVLAIAVYDIKGDDTKIVRFLMPIGLMLRPGFRFSADKGATIEGGFEICFPNGCFAEAKVKHATIEAMKKANVLNISVKNQVNSEVTFVTPMDGFGKAFDGPAIDPKVLEEQQKQLTEQLQKRAEEERKKLGATPGGAPAPAAPAPAAPAPAAPAPAAPKQ